MTEEEQKSHNQQPSGKSEDIKLIAVGVCLLLPLLVYIIQASPSHAVSEFRRLLAMQKDSRGAGPGFFVFLWLFISCGLILSGSLSLIVKRRRCEQDIRQVSSESAPSAPPDEPSM